MGAKLNSATDLGARGLDKRLGQARNCVLGCFAAPSICGTPARSGKIQAIRWQMKGIIIPTGRFRESVPSSLYRRAFAEYGTRALWNKHALEAPTLEDALVIARALRIEGNREAR
jgi:hypothetical protein